MRNFGIALIIFGLLHFSAVNGSAQMTTDESLSKFVSAGMAYKEGQYDLAIQRYNEIVQGGRESGATYYNLGNSYFRKGDLGRTVLNYERAKRLIPRDSDLNFNYRHVLSRIERLNNGKKESLLDKAIKNHIQFYTTDEMVLIIAGVIFAVGIGFLLSLYLSWPRSLSQGMMALLLFILMVYGVGLTAKAQHEEGLAVTVTKAESYFEPRVDSIVHFKLPEGMKVKILKSEGGWVKVQRMDGKAGWVSQDVLEEILIVFKISSAAR